MKVILTQDVKGRGKEGDVIEVARGFAVNYLLPRKIAVEATPGNLKQLEARMHNIKQREEAKRGDAESLAAAIEGKTITIEAKAGEEGRLYGSVTSAMIGEAIAAQLGVEVDRRKLDIQGHIKTLGEHEVAVQVYYDVKADLVVKVVPEGGELLAPVETEKTQAEVIEEIVAQAEALEAAAEAAAEEEQEAAEDAEQE
ncbi:MAG: 50S ribosomal protein L9 [Anaerosomatales bacterium]|nr:50S ribosomal protein L9 [Anaerosomatales bacterium]